MNRWFGNKDIPVLREYRKWAKPEDRCIYRSETAVGWLVKISVPKKLRGRTGHHFLTSLILDSEAGNKEEALALARIERDRLKSHLRLLTTSDRRGGYVRSRTNTGVVGVSFVWKKGKVVAFRTSFRNEGLVHFYFSTMTPEVAWRVAVKHRFRKEGRGWEIVPPMPKIPEDKE